jgi:hypothetical protein
VNWHSLIGDAVLIVFLIPYRRYAEEWYDSFEEFKQWEKDSKEE